MTGRWKVNIAESYVGALSPTGGPGGTPELEGAIPLAEFLIRLDELDKLWAAKIRLLADEMDEAEAAHIQMLRERRAARRAASESHYFL